MWCIVCNSIYRIKGWANGMLSSKLPPEFCLLLCLVKKTLLFFSSSFSCKVFGFTLLSIRFICYCHICGFLYLCDFCFFSPHFLNLLNWCAAHCSVHLQNIAMQTNNTFAFMLGMHFNETSNDVCCI